MDSMHAKNSQENMLAPEKSRHDRMNGEVKDQDLAAFLKRVKLNNQANIGNPNRLKRVNHYPIQETGTRRRRRKRNLRKR